MLITSVAEPGPEPVEAFLAGAGASEFWTGSSSDPKATDHVK